MHARSCFAHSSTIPSFWCAQSRSGWRLSHSELGSQFSYRPFVLDLSGLVQPASAGELAEVPDDANADNWVVASDALAGLENLDVPDGGIRADRNSAHQWEGRAAAAREENEAAAVLSVEQSEEIAAEEAASARPQRVGADRSFRRSSAAVIGEVSPKRRRLGGAK